MLAPIPRYILVHSCILRKTVSPDPWGGGSYSDTAINFVRIEPCNSRKFSLGGDIPEISAKMFYDCFSSVPDPDPDPDPDDVSFEPKDKIIFGGKEYVITEVRTFYGDTGKAHHLEVMLS